jgi:hypothetical protein
MKFCITIIGNIAVGSIAWSWWWFTSGNRTVLILGMAYIGLSIIAGTFIGYGLSLPEKKRRTKNVYRPDASAFDQIR